MRKKIVSQIIGEITNVMRTRGVPYEAMIDDIRLMRFKMRPLTGDISSMRKIHKELVESIWKIGKIDILLTARLPRLHEDEKKAVLEHVSSIQQSLFRHLRNVETGEDIDEPNGFKIALFRDEKEHTKYN